MPPDLDSDATPLLALPLLAAAQAQKHVTHNEALLLLDAALHVHLLALDATDPPQGPAEGDRYALGPEPTGAWAGRGGTVAVWTLNGWRFVRPRRGWTARLGDGAEPLFHDGTRWQADGGGSGGGGGGAPERVARLGVNAEADDANLLTVASAATLFNHDGADHRLAVNRARRSDTASIVFQSAFSGRAEMGVAGDDAFRIKVSGDGKAWTTALRVDPTTGRVALPATPPAAFCGAPTQTGEPIPNGATIRLAAVHDPAGAGRSDGFVAPEAGTYAVALSVVAVDKTAGRAGVWAMRDGAIVAECEFRDVGGAPTWSATALVGLEAGDRITFRCFAAGQGGNLRLVASSRFSVFKVR